MCVGESDAFRRSTLLGGERQFSMQNEFVATALKAARSHLYNAKANRCSLSIESSVTKAWHRDLE